MKKFTTVPQAKKALTQHPPTRMNAVDFQALTSTIAKSVFPNGDPNFFIPSYRQDNDSGTMANPYANNVWVYAACSAITTNLIPLPRVLDVIKTPEKEMIDINPVLDILENPNPLMDGPTFWEHVILNLMLPTKTTKGGQCFILSESLTKNPPNLKRGDIPRELYPFSDEFITPVLDKNDGITLLGWKFQPDPEKPPTLYKPEEVIRVHMVDPKHPLKGQAPIWSARQGLRSDMKAQVLNERFFDNNASLGGVLETDAELEPGAGRELRESFEARYSGQDNAGRTALLHSGVKYQMFQQSHKDMEFIEQRKWTREEILAAYGVPKFSIGVYEDINFATANASNKSFWQNTLVPLDQRVLRAFTNQWVKFTNNGTYKLETDYTKVLALAPDLTEKLDQAKKLFFMQVPLEEINNRLELQLELGEYDWLKTALVSGTLKPAEQILLAPAPDPEPETNMEPTSAGEPAEEEPLGPVEEAMKNLGNLARKAEDEEFSAQVYEDEILLPDEKKFHKMLKGYFREQRNVILDWIDAWAGSAKSTKAGEEGFEGPDFKKFAALKRAEDKKILALGKPEYIRMATAEASVVQVEIGGKGDWKLDSPEMREGFKERLTQVKKINTTTFKSARGVITRTVQEAIREGLGQKATAKLLKKEINKVYTGRINSETIARTEVNAIHSFTRSNIYKHAGIKWVKWLTRGDGLVRNGSKGGYSHVVLNGQTQLRTKGFNNGQRIRFPHDPGASPSNTINCRCFITAVRKKEKL